MFLFLITKLFEKFLQTVFLFTVLFNEILSFVGHNGTEWKGTDKRTEKIVCWDVKLIKTPFNFLYSLHEKMNYIARPSYMLMCCYLGFGFRNRNSNIHHSAFYRETVLFSWSEIVLIMYIMSILRPPEKFLKRRNLKNSMLSKCIWSKFIF